MSHQTREQAIIETIVSAIMLVGAICLLRYGPTSGELLAIMLGWAR